MFKLISDLEDKSAAGIVRAADAGELPDDARYSEIIREARNLVADGRGDLLYAGAYRGKPRWAEPADEGEAGAGGGEEA